MVQIMECVELLKNSTDTVCILTPAATSRCYNDQELLLTANEMAMASCYQAAWTTADQYMTRISSLGHTVRPVHACCEDQGCWAVHLCPTPLQYKLLQIKSSKC